MKNGKGETQVVKGIEIKTGFWKLLKQDQEYAYFTQKNKHFRLVIPLNQLGKLEMIEREVKV